MIALKAVWFCCLIQRQRYSKANYCNTASLCFVTLLMALMDLSGDGLRAILQHLQPKDLCRCKLVCRKLGALASEVRVSHCQTMSDTALCLKSV